MLLLCFKGWRPNSLCTINYEHACTIMILIVLTSQSKQLPGVGENISCIFASSVMKNVDSVHVNVYVQCTINAATLYKESYTCRSTRTYPHRLVQMKTSEHHLYTGSCVRCIGSIGLNCQSNCSLCYSCKWPSSLLSYRKRYPLVHFLGLVEARNHLIGDAV